MTTDDFDDLFSDEPIENVELDFNIIERNLPQYSNEKLCEMIVCDRYFGFGKRIDIMCMEELAKRRLAGDTFNFESYIDQVHKELPVLSSTPPDLREVLTQAMNQINLNRK
jgi:hypothetical protein